MSSEVLFPLVKIIWLDTPADDEVEWIHVNKARIDVSENVTAGFLVKEDNDAFLVVASLSNYDHGDKYSFCGQTTILKSSVKNVQCYLNQDRVKDEWFDSDGYLKESYSWE